MLTPFAAKIERLQAQHGLSHSALALRAGMSRQTLYRVKRSKTPHMTTIHKIAKALRVPVDYFF